MKSPSLTIKAGFTLVELLVAIAILAIILVAVAQIVGATSSLTVTSDKHIDANSQARSVFDRMANDFARMVKRNDVDYIFCKVSGSGSQGANDTMFFYSEGAGYFDNTTSGSTFSLTTGYSGPSPEKNSVSLVGYRINNTSGSSDYFQLERLGKALSWDASASLNPVVFLTYPSPGIDVAGIDQNNGTNPPSGGYSTAYFASTLWGAYSNGSGGKPSLVGTLANNFSDGTDSFSSPTPTIAYRSLGAQVFRFEFSFQLKDGTQSSIPVMAAATPSNPNGVPSSTITGTQRPIYTSSGNTYALDSTQSLATAGSGSPNGASVTIGSRYWDATNHIGYICLDATPHYAIWHEIGIQDIAAIVVTIGVIDKQGLVFVNKAGFDMKTLSAQFPDGIDSTVNNTWTAAITPASAGAKSAVSTATGIPQEMVSQIRIYQRFFYINNL